MAGQSVQLVGVTPQAKRAFQKMLIVVVGLNLAKTQLQLAVQPNCSSQQKLGFIKRVDKG